MYSSNVVLFYRFRSLKYGILNEQRQLRHTFLDVGSLYRRFAIDELASGAAIQNANEVDGAFTQDVSE